MRILIGMECSAIIRDEFRAKGHDAWSCDLKPCEGDPRWHLQGDVFHHINKHWDIGIFHPSCRYLSVSGARWLYEKPEWANNQLMAIHDAEALWLSRDLFAVGFGLENPVGILSTKSILGKATQYIQPWMFGDNFLKKTGLWLDRLPPLKPTSDLDGSTAVAACWKCAPTKDPEERRTIRARTYPGIAKAMADQWALSHDCKPTNEKP